MRSTDALGKGLATDLQGFLVGQVQPDTRLLGLEHFLECKFHELILEYAVSLQSLVRRSLRNTYVRKFSSLAKLPVRISHTKNKPLFWQSPILLLQVCCGRFSHL